MSEKLNLILRKIIREELRTELSIFKSEILNEIRKSSGHRIIEQPNRNPVPSRKENSVPVKRTQPPIQKPKTKYSNDPFLQALLEETEPIRDPSPSSFREIMQMDSHDMDLPVEEVDDLSEIFQERPKASRTPVQIKHIPNRKEPLVTEDINGVPVNTANPKVKEVLDIMNMDFSGKLKAMNEAAKNLRQGMG